MKRRTMLEPMRPRPIMPTFIRASFRSSSFEAPRTPRLFVHGDRALPDLGRPPASIPCPPEAKIQPGPAHPETVKRDLREPARELRIDIEPAPRGVGADAEDRLQQVKDTSRRPGLRHVGLGIDDRERPGAALD